MHARAATAGVKEIPRTTWAQAKAAGVAGRSRAPALDRNVCCHLRPGQHQVNFVEDCSVEDLLATNWTAKALTLPPTAQPVHGG